MKQLLSLFLVLSMALSLSGCATFGENPEQTSSDAAAASSKLTAEQAEEGNTVKSLLGRYETITYSQLDYIGGKTTHLTFFTNESGSPCLIEDDNDYTAYRTDAFSFVRENGESEYRLFAGQQANISKYLLMVPDSKFTTRTVDSDGNLVCEALADIDQDYADELSDWSVTTADKMLTTTAFAADDDRVLSIDFTIRHPDGSVLKIASGVVLYDQEVQYPDEVQSYLDAEKYTVTVQMPDGRMRTALIPKGETFSWDCDEGCALYLDKDGKTLLPEEPDPVQSNLTMYCLPKK